MSDCGHPPACSTEEDACSSTSSTAASCPPSPDCSYERYKRKRGVTFASLITPVCGLHAAHSCQGDVEFTMRRSNNVVTLQWEPFHGYVIPSGVRHLTVAQTINNLPSYELSFPLRIIHRGREMLGGVLVDPCQKYGHGNIHFVLPPDSSANDAFEIPGSCISWVVE